MRKSLREDCIERGDMTLLRQWQSGKNGTLTPDGVAPGSHKLVWWQCEKGHGWQATVKSRVEGCGCPVCANRATIPGFNDLATTEPALAAQWHPTKNGALTPRDVVAGTLRRVWWRCDRGHEWQAAVASRVNGAGCPVCAGKVILPGENDLATCFPAVAAQWHRERNGALTPETISPYSSKKVWWKCEKGHSYQMEVAYRVYRNSGCPYCSGRKVLPGFNDLASVEPETAKQWHPTLNGTLTPDMVTAGSSRKVWWQCPDGHVWKAVISSRTGKQKCGCPVCAGRVKEDRVERYAAVIARDQRGEHP